ncbi:MAG: hypothetical protein LW823_02690 [Rickettsiales bacterium]|nr:hypothetical protein [Rickettsiales bacterium]
MQKKTLSRWWLLIGVAALAIAGLYSLVLAGGRSPKIGDSSLLNRLFHEALVIHVDLSVLVWFLAIACLMWSLLMQGSRQVIPYLEEGALWCFALGTAAITLSPLDPNGLAMMSNYIPVIHSPVFFFGLMLVFCGVALMLIKLFSSRFEGDDHFALLGAAIITVVALVAFIWSFMLMPDIIEGEQYYDMLFWGGGHVLQFTHTQVMMVVWLVLASMLWSVNHSQRFLKGVFMIGVLAIAITPMPYFLFDITSMAFRDFFTNQMIVAGGIAPVILLAVMLPKLAISWMRGNKEGRVYRAALTMSIVLFLYGGLLGLMIRGQNVVIPAHYHGSIVGITLAFMGYAYYILPKLGYVDVTRWKTAWLQPYIYGIGQIMHVSGFAWSGGYGALRKTPGGSYEGTAQIAMGLMGGGAGLAAIGGLMFVIVISRSVYLGRKKITVM